MTPSIGSFGSVTRAVAVLLAAALFVVAAALFVVAPASADPGDPVDPVGVWPLAPGPDRVVHPFDPPAGPYGAGHRGVDLAGRVGEPVHTALPGTVLYAGRIAGVGVVTVGHGDTRTTYEPVDATVSVGQPVAGGAVVGRLELAGSHCFPAVCLHWGWIRGATYLDPLRLVGDPGPVRLLPWSGLGSAPGAAPPPPSSPGLTGWVALVGVLGA